MSSSKNHLPLFDEPTPKELAAEQAAKEEQELWIGDSEWREAPQEVYLSWPPDQQARYQEARDRDSAAHANDDWWMVFFIRRSKTWQQ